MLLIVPAALLVPLATLFAHNKAAVMAQLFFAMAVNSVADTSAYSGSNVLVRLPIRMLFCLLTLGMQCGIWAGIVLPLFQIGMLFHWLILACSLHNGWISAVRIMIPVAVLSQ